MKTFSLLCLAGWLTVSATAAMADDDEGWSQPVNGLSARVVVQPPTGKAGRQILDVYLELKHSTNVSATLDFSFDYHGTLRFKLFDEAGKEVPQTGRSVDGTIRHGFRNSIPYGGILRFPVKWHGNSFMGITAVTNQPVQPLVKQPERRSPVELSFVQDFWVIVPEDGKKYYLLGVFSVPATAKEAFSLGINWNGTITTPKTLVPTLPTSPNRPTK
jgi:hypothetical protein